MGEEDEEDAYGDEGFKKEQEAEYDFMWDPTQNITFQHFLE
jgi:hypothetical protein